MIVLNNVGSPVIGIGIVPSTKLNIAMLSNAPRVNYATVVLAGLHY